MIQRHNEIFWLSSNLLQRAGQRYSDKILGYNPIAYWPLWEAGGSVAECLINPAQNGTYVGATVGQTVTDANGVSFVCPLLDGINDYVDVQSAAFAAALDVSEGSCLIWARVFNAAVWTDGTENHVFRFLTDDSNFIGTHKLTNNNFLIQRYRAGGTLEAINRTPFSPVNWVPYVITWSVIDDIVKAYYDGSNETTSAGLGVWVGALVASWIGQWSVGFGKWYGWVANCAVLDSILTPAQIADLAVV